MRRVSGSKRHAIGIGAAVAISALVAIVIVLLTRPAPAPTYTIDPKPLGLTIADIGTDFVLLTDSNRLPPAQRTTEPLPYQQQYLGGHLRHFMTQSALSGAGRTEIENWERQNGFPPTDPPTILGPFVEDHSGIFEINDAERRFRTVDSAKQEFHCCTFHHKTNFDGYSTPPVQLGDEAIAFACVLIDKNDTDDAYLEQEFAIDWRRGPIVSSVSILGAHDIILAQVNHLAQIVDQRITLALQQSSNEHQQFIQEVTFTAGSLRSRCT